MAKTSRPRAARKPGKAAGETSTSGARPIWTGILRLSLVSVPVVLVPATRSSAHLALHQIHGPSGQRIHYDKTAAGVGSVEADDIEKAVEVSKDRYVVVTDAELESLKIEAKRTLDLVQFVDHCEIEPIWYERPYYLLPDGADAEEPYGVLRDALRASNKVGIGQFVMRNHDYVAALKPVGDGMMLETLRYADEVKDATGVFASIRKIKADAELLDLAKELIARKSSAFDADKFHDRYAEALRQLVEAKAKHQRFIDVEDEPESGGGKVIDLVEALKRSLRESGSGPSKSAPAAMENGSARSTAGQDATGKDATDKNKKAPASKPAKAAAPAKRKAG